MLTMDHTAEEMLELTIDRFWESFPPVWDKIRGNIRLIVTDRFDITVEQFHILRHIRKGARSVSELAAVRQISRAGMSQAIDILVDKGLISRRHRQNDRRYIVLELTSDGNILLNAIFSENRNWMRGKLGPLSLDELSIIFRGMEALKGIFVDSAE
jgi:DNA-binding MarR family transcriptional regulator